MSSWFLCFVVIYLSFVSCLLSNCVVSVFLMFFNFKVCSFCFLNGLIIWVIFWVVFKSCWYVFLLVWIKMWFLFLVLMIFILGNCFVIVFNIRLWSFLWMLIDWRIVLFVLLSVLCSFENNFLIFKWVCGVVEIIKCDEFLFVIMIVLGNLWVRVFW